MTPTEREVFEDWLDAVTRHQDSRMPTPRETWRASRKQALEEAARLFPSKNPMPGNDIAGLIRSLLK